MYDLRHSSATLSIAAGTDIKTVSTRLGHSDIRTTLNIYTHTLDEMDKKQVIIWKICYLKVMSVVSLIVSCQRIVSLKYSKVTISYKCKY